MGKELVPNMIPSERSLVDLCKSETTALVGVLDVEEVIVEVVVSGITARGLQDLRLARSRDGLWFRRHGTGKGVCVYPP